VGLGLIFVPLTNLALADLPLGKIHNGTGLFNLMRQLGGSVGIALSATLLQRFTAIHRSDLMASVTPYAAAAQQRMWQIQAALLAKGTPPALVQDKALRLLDAAVRKQALMLSFEQLFLLFGGAFMISLPILAFMHRPKVAPGGGAAH
jgi:DHA2 family multidrug resistance protein